MAWRNIGIVKYVLRVSIKAPGRELSFHHSALASVVARLSAICTRNAYIQTGRTEQEGNDTEENCEERKYTSGKITILNISLLTKTKPMNAGVAAVIRWNSIVLFQAVFN